MQLKNKIALITGASSGIGKAIAEKFSEEGAIVIITSQDLNKIKAISKKIKNSYPIKLDVSDKKQVENSIKEVIKRFKKIDILVNNAGIAEWGKVIDVPYEHFERQIAVNLIGTIYCTKAVLPYMAKQSSGTIINISSGLGKRGEAECSGYCASKFGLMGFSESIADEFKEYKIKVHIISPGMVDTPIHDSYMAKNSDERKKMLIPEDIAEVALFLVTLPYNVGIKEISVRPNYS